MWMVYKRMGELTAKNELTKEEQTELKHCLKMNENMVRQMAELDDKCYLAFITEDHQWLHELSAQIEDLQNKMIGMPSGYSIGKAKKNSKNKKKTQD